MGAKRDRFRREVYERDNYQCVKCKADEGEVEQLDAHHITDRDEMPNGGYVPENGITLCPDCHWKAEQYHISDGWHWEKGYHPNTLYFLIGSSYELALEKSKEL